MSLLGRLFKTVCTIADRRRDKGLEFPSGVFAARDIEYIPGGGKFNLLDVYYEKGAEQKRPVIVIVHGGGYVYGTKEVYEKYGAYLAQQGFTVVNYNYHLAPKTKFPVQLTELNAVLHWMAVNAGQYFLDINNVFLAGDSAGAQIASHYAAVYSNPEYAKEFPFTPPAGVKIRALGLSCGIYDFPDKNSLKSEHSSVGLSWKPLLRDYMGRDLSRFDKMLHITDNITRDFPPAFVMTAEYDFMKPLARPMYDLLISRGVDAEYKLYGATGQKYMRHVFHVNMNLPEAKECNREMSEFFKKYVVKTLK